MTSRKPVSDGVAIPAHRLSRMARFGGLAGSIAGDALVRGAGALARGERPEASSLLLTPANAAKVAEQLARLRGAAMKVGQMMSLDAGDLLPPELSDILARLRDDGHHMPARQLKIVLNDNWGHGWLKKFSRFDVNPIAAASIGQVHRAVTKDGRELAIKVQFPGVRKSIDSDVDNVATLIKLSGLLPAGVDFSPLLEEAKRQLHEEADYVREGQHLKAFGDLLGDDLRFEVPALQEDLTTENILAMTFVEGEPIEAIESASQGERDRVMETLISLMFRELFDFRLMQTDPNFANYRFNRDTGKIVLLDFGATRSIEPGLVEAYRQLLGAGTQGDLAAIRAAAINIGFLTDDIAPHNERTLMEMFDASFEPLRLEGPFDFGGSDVVARLRDQSMDFAERRDFFHLPPTETLFLQRKFGGIFLLAAKLNARVDIAGLLAPYLGDAISRLSDRCPAGPATTI